MSRLPLLFVSPTSHDQKVGGREQLSHLHRESLRELLGPDFHEMQTSIQPTSGVLAKLAALSGRIDGADRNTLATILSRIDENGIARVWLDGTNLGWIAQGIKLARPSLEIVTFAHNVETKFFRDSLRQKPSLRTLAVYIANQRAERLSTQYSDQLLAICGRDSALFGAMYGRCANAILPMALADRLEELSEPPRPHPYLLFVGGAFYANLEGAAWYARSVAPYISIPTIVVGRGMTSALTYGCDRAGIELVGEVPDLASWYAGALAVVAPIFSGSGMKTKVAEAWMFGKRVVGTPEAFTGYEIPTGCQVCESADEFVTAINALIADPSPAFDPSMRASFERSHSATALKSQMAKILEPSSQHGRS